MGLFMSDEELERMPSWRAYGAGVGAGVLTCLVVFLLCLIGMAISGCGGPMGAPDAGVDMAAAVDGGCEPCGVNFCCPAGFACSPSHDCLPIAAPADMATPNALALATGGASVTLRSNFWSKSYSRLVSVSTINRELFWVTSDRRLHIGHGVTAEQIARAYMQHVEEDQRALEREQRQLEREADRELQAAQEQLEQAAAAMVTAQ